MDHAKLLKTRTMQELQDQFVEFFEQPAEQENKTSTRGILKAVTQYHERALEMKREKLIEHDEWEVVMDDCFWFLEDGINFFHDKQGFEGDIKIIKRYYKDLSERYNALKSAELDDSVVAKEG